MSRVLTRNRCRRAHSRRRVKRSVRFRITEIPQAKVMDIEIMPMAAVGNTAVMEMKWAKDMVLLSAGENRRHQSIRSLPTSVISAR